MIRHEITAWSVTWSVHDQPRDQCMVRHVNSVWSATWTVHAQSRDQALLSCVITVCSSAWQLPAELHDSCLSSAWQLPAVLRNSCLLSCLIIVPCSTKRQQQLPHLFSQIWHCINRSKLSTYWARLLKNAYCIVLLYPPPAHFILINFNLKA